MRVFLLVGALLLAGSPVLASAAATTGCDGASVGPATEIVSNQARHTAGLEIWPDTAIGVLPDGDGKYRFLSAGNPDGKTTRVTVTKGTLDNPIADGTLAQDTVIGTPPQFNYLAGGPVYHDPASGMVLQLLHAERWYQQNTLFYSELQLGVFDPATNRTRYLGEVVRPNADFASVQANKTNADLGTPALTVQTVDGVSYLSLYFADFFTDPAGRIGTTTLSVARAPLSEVLSAAANGSVSPWTKYYNGGWTEPAIGGRSSSIQSGTMAWAPSVMRVPGLDTTVMVAGVSPHQFVLSTSADGLTGWSDRFTLFRDPESYDAYPTVVPVAQNQFYVYYTQWPNTVTPDWNNTRLMRRLVTCTGGQGTSFTTLVGYSDGGAHHRVSTGTVTTPGFSPDPGAVWTVPATAQPGTRPIFGCRTGSSDYLLSVDANCEGDGNALLQTEGWLYTSPPAQPSTALYRCHAQEDHFLWTDSSCPGGVLDGMFGYALTTSKVPFARYANGKLHWVTTGRVSADYASEDSQWFLESSSTPGTTALYGCQYVVPTGIDHFISGDPACEGATVSRTEGWIYSSPPPGTPSVALYRCYSAAAYDHFVSRLDTCEGATKEGRLGYALVGAWDRHERR